MGKRIFQRKTIIIIMAVVATIVLLLVFLKSCGQEIQEVIMPDDSKLPNTYNASRYFFRIGYPDDWSVESDVGGAGFMCDKEKGIVIKLYPTAEIGKATSIPTVSDETGDHNSSGGKLSIVDEKISTVVNIFYREIKQGDKVSSDEACRRFMTEFADGIMYANDGFKAEYSFGSISEEKGDRETFYRVDYNCKLYRLAEDGSTQESEPIQTVNGELYVVSRSMAYYAVNFETDLSTVSSLYDEYHKDFKNIINDFRFSVFDD